MSYQIFIINLKYFADFSCVYNWKGKVRFGLIWVSSIQAYFEVRNNTKAEMNKFVLEQQNVLDSKQQLFGLLRRYYGQLQKQPPEVFCKKRCS